MALPERARNRSDVSELRAETSAMVLSERASDCSDVSEPRVETSEIVLSYRYADRSDVSDPRAEMSAMALCWRERNSSDVSERRDEMSEMALPESRKRSSDASDPRREMSEMGLSVRESSVRFTACSSPAKLPIDALDAKKYLSFAMSSCVTVAPVLLPSALSNFERRLASAIVTAHGRPVVVRLRFASATSAYMPQATMMPAGAGRSSRKIFSCQGLSGSRSNNAKCPSWASQASM